MTRDSIGVLAGLTVMIAGLISISSLGDTGNAETETAAMTSETTLMTTTTVAGPQTVEIPLPDLQGLPPEVQRVLYSKGTAEAVTYGDLAELPPVIERVLIQYEAPLMVPSEAASEPSP